MTFNILLSYLSVYLLLQTFIIVSAEYYIKQGAIPSYLYHKFDNVKEEMFPLNIRIKLSMSRLDGTLLYFLDRNKYQMIVSLYHSEKSSIGIEFNKQHFNVPLSNLCGCDRCRYEPLDVRIQLLSQISIQCNGGVVRRFKYGRKIALNLDYPRPFVGDETRKPLTDAHLWLVNTPQFNEVYPNQNQLSGCIFGVWNDDRTLNFEDVSDNIESICRKACVDNVCNGGHCYESYNGEPVCNCTKRFLNGKFCNDSIHNTNIMSSTQRLNFEMLKLSWTSSVNELFVLENPKASLKISRMNEHLFFQYEYFEENNIAIKGTLSKEYVPDHQYICVVRFHENKIDIWLFNNDSHHITVLSNRDLRNEIFTKMTLRSGNGKIDLVYKTSHTQYRWRKVDTLNFTEIYNDTNNYDNNSVPDNYSIKDNGNTTSFKNIQEIILSKSTQTLIVSSIFFIILWVTSLILLWMHIRPGTHLHLNQQDDNTM